MTSYLWTVTGERAPVHGRYRFDLLVKIGNTEVLQQMWIADIRDQCTIGLDFLAPQGWLVNLEDNRLRIDGEKATLQRLTSQPVAPLCRCALLDKTIDIPAHSEFLALVKVEGSLLANGNMDSWSQINHGASME